MQIMWKLCKFQDGRTVKKHSKKHIYTKQQNQTRPAVSWKKKSAFFENVFFFAKIWSEQKKVDEVLLVKQQTNLVKT